jgi:hypothetical protein
VTNEEFYNRCADLLDSDYNYVTPVRKTRWSSRGPGNGRFPNHGLIRCFGDIIFVNLYNPKITGIFTDKQNVLDNLSITFLDN